MGLGNGYLNSYGRITMRIDISRDMWRKIIIYSLSFTIAILIYTLVSHISDVKNILASLLGILAPFLFGAAFAFLLNKPSNWVEKWLKEQTNMKPRRCRLLAVTIIFVAALLILAGIIAFIIPSLLDSIQQFARNISLYSASYNEFLTGLSQSFGMDSQQTDAMLKQLDLFPALSEALNTYLPKLADMGMDVLRFFMNAFIALASCFYIMLDRDSLLAGCRKMSYSLFSKPTAQYLSLYSKDVETVFEKYIVGNLLDALIVGVATYIGALIAGIPYAPMFAVLIGITNIIPVFGPFLGGVPSVIILFLIKPWYGFVAAIFILVLQQLDGNVIKPIILGDQLGMSSFWILFSVSVGGALFGIAGMFLGVPIFALIYAAVRDFADIRLAQKHIDLDKKAG